MATLDLYKQVAAGVSVSGKISQTVDTSIGIDYNPQAGQAGALTTRTDDDEGSITMTESGHTITTGATVDIFWATGMRYGVTIGTVAAKVCPFSGGAGDNLPDNLTAVVVCIQTTQDIDVVGDKIKMLAVSSQYRASVDFLDSGGNVLLHIPLAAGEIQDWTYGSMHTNPVAGDTIASATVTSGTTTAANVKGVIGYDG